ncbi:hypothetical protein HanRHA438_Chr14g0652881 [Helianthus annuus]|uniref:Uncharacterized protein n=1 Tax=Helianthus annuus TaxID=4232 RepID=A0A251STP1_HELAN|nr:hypothetical protein HanHA300_Chr14g0522741 [Helianthus annuus]KAJ0468449.1 hypothetical protein HanIR_Chr14g0696741 [Helianthus annuus]KAJ0485601.1 hypothetical protein HanHA89_Chr14g0570151 [Helianthus annuus]KAJ0656153.1 hypothetical protein HanLR1_Chr14g0532541 [Helianthus annuus]KAJ0659819.1 hypothetical protein HanOQP8_Chr14g0530541 [Helianthus annuus]
MPPHIDLSGKTSGSKLWAKARCPYPFFTRLYKVYNNPNSSVFSFTPFMDAHTFFYKNPFSLLLQPLQKPKPSFKP